MLEYGLPRQNKRDNDLKTIKLNIVALYWSPSGIELATTSAGFVYLGVEQRP